MMNRGYDGNAGGKEENEGGKEENEGGKEKTDFDSCYTRCFKQK